MKYLGASGANIYGDIHHRNVYPNCGFRIHLSPKQLHEKSLESHGLCGRCVRVIYLRNNFHFVNTFKLL